MKDTMYSRILQGETTYKDAQKFKMLSFLLWVIGFVSFAGVGYLAYKFLVLAG